MKQYLLFGGLTFYPGGGWSDFRGSYNEINVAVATAKAGEDRFSDFDWWHVINADTGDKVAEGGTDD